MSQLFGSVSPFLLNPPPLTLWFLRRLEQLRLLPGWWDCNCLQQMRPRVFYWRRCLLVMFAQFHLWWLYRQYYDYYFEAYVVIVYCWLLFFFLGLLNCDKCSDATHCTSCSLGFYWDGSGCQACLLQGISFVLRAVFMSNAIWFSNFAIFPESISAYFCGLFPRCALGFYLLMLV